MRRIYVVTYSIHCTLYYVQCTSYSIRRMGWAWITLYNIFCTTCSVRRIMYSVGCTVYDVQCTMSEHVKGPVYIVVYVTVINHSQLRMKSNPRFQESVIIFCSLAVKKRLLQNLGRRVCLYSCHRVLWNSVTSAFNYITYYYYFTIVEQLIYLYILEVFLNI